MRHVYLHVGLKAHYNVGDYQQFVMKLSLLAKWPSLGFAARIERAMWKEGILYANATRVSRVRHRGWCL